MTRTGSPDDGSPAPTLYRRGVLAATGTAVATAGCTGLPIGIGATQTFDTPESVVTTYLHHHPLATSMSPEEYADRARRWWHSRTAFFDGLEDAMTNPFGGEEDGSGGRTVEILEISTTVRNLTTEQLLGLDPNVGVSGSIGDFADEKTALVDTLWQFESDTEVAYEADVGELFNNETRYLTATEDDEWQILTSVS